MTERHASLFRNGRNQAVRIPREYCHSTSLPTSTMRTFARRWSVEDWMASAT
jgi:hypothetical protein